MSDKTLDLANSIAEVLSGEDLDDVIPALVMVIAHAARMTNIPTDAFIGFIEKTMNIQSECDDSTTTH